MADAERDTPLGVRYVERLLRRIFNTAGPVSTQFIGGKVQPSVEVRPQFPEDFVDYGVIPFAAAQLVPAVAAQAGVMRLVGDSAGLFDIVVHTVVIAGDNGFLRIGNSTTWGSTAGVNVVPTDSRMDFGVVLSNITSATWANAAPGGQDIYARLNNASPLINTDRGLVVLRAVSTGNAAACAVVGATVNTAAYVTFMGYMVPTNFAGL